MCSHTGDKTKWVPLKAEITVNPSSGGASKAKAKGARVASGAGGPEKKGAAAPASQAAQQGQQPSKAAKAGSPAGQGTHPLPAKPPGQAQTSKAAKKAAAAAGSPPPANRPPTLDTSVDSEGIIRPFGTLAAPNSNIPASESSSPSTSASPSLAQASKPDSASTASDAPSSTPATTAAPSTTGSEPNSAQPPQQGLPRQHAVFVQPPAQQAFAGRGRGRGGVPMRGARGGARGGMNGNGFGRVFHQQQQHHAAMTAAGYVPVPVDVDAYGYPILDAYGYPVAAAQQQAAPVDPRMLDPTRYWLLGQIEWWFSVDNLCRDLFLRQQVRSRPLPVSTSRS